MYMQVHISFSTYNYLSIPAHIYIHATIEIYVYVYT